MAMAGGQAQTQDVAPVNSGANPYRVIPTDASLAASDYETAIGIYQVLNQSSANTTNEPLKMRASTLSRSDMITFQ
jgi:hypothetical protein